MPVKDANAEGAARFPHDDLRRVEKAIRRIVRANDLRSRALMKTVGLTAAQLVVLKGIERLGEVTTTALSAEADLSAATVITVLDNLEERGTIERYRSSSDRRVVHTRLTQKGRALLDSAPEPLSDAFAARFAALPEARRQAIIGAVSELADLTAGEPKAGAEKTLRDAALSHMKSAPHP
jgi:DNA-binding MarR family transcriptional regulator